VPGEILNVATARRLLEDEPNAEATPVNLVELKKFRESSRRRTPAGNYDISCAISEVIPPSESHPVPAAPEIRQQEADPEPAPAEVRPQIPPVQDLVPHPVESVPKGKERPSLRSRILKEASRLKKICFAPTPLGISLFTVVFLVIMMVTVGYIVPWSLLPMLEWVLK
jgi:hypothetical protein